MDFRQRLEQNRTKPIDSEVPAELEPGITCAYFATDRTQSPACLDLRLTGGIRKALPYAYFTEVNYDSEKGIEILTCGKQVRIMGRNRTRLFESLITYRVRYVQANIGNDTNEDGLFVKEILIEDL